MTRERSVVMAALAGITATSWLYLIVLAGRIDGTMPVAVSPALHSWSAGEFLLTVVMWLVMMIGMMVPGVTPMVLTFATINRRRRERDRPYVPTAVFTAGYLLAWGAFSVGATAIQWGLEEAALLSPMLVSTSPILGGLLLVAAGVYQWTPLKHACLRNCRSPLSFILTRWRDGARGALSMGVAHGAYCLGCCWLIMALLFVGGVMNLLWVAAIAAFVVLEKLLPAGHRLARVAGALMVLAGLYSLLPG